VLIADPEAFSLPGDHIEEPPLTENQQRKAYAQDTSSRASKDWNARVARAQRAAGANVLLTPGCSLDPSVWRAALDEATAAIDAVQEVAESAEVAAWNLTLPPAWLADARLRDQLLAHLIDRDDVNVWHVRVRWPLIRPPFGQTGDAAVLAGYKDFCETAAREERSLLLPTSGLTGWLALGWGAGGFGTGPSATTQAWADRPRIASKKGQRRTRVDRIFSRPLLHTVSVDSHRNLVAALADDVYPDCECAFCQGNRDSPAWNRSLAAAHAVYSMGQLAAEVARRSPRLVPTMLQAS
jgi:hypothetical protein